VLFKLLLRILVNTAAFYCAVRLFPLIILHSPTDVVWAGIVLGLVNSLIRPILFLLTLPVNFVTFGLFTLVLNTWMVMFADWLVPGLNIPGFWLSLAVALLISVFNWLLKSLQQR